MAEGVAQLFAAARERAAAAARAGGIFILVDETSDRTVAAGAICAEPEPAID